MLRGIDFAAFAVTLKIAAGDTPAVAIHSGTLRGQFIPNGSQSDEALRMYQKASPGDPEASQSSLTQLRSASE